MGLSAAYLGSFGGDDAGTQIRAEMARRGVDVQHALIRDVANRHALILIDQRTGERIVLWHRDPQLQLTPGDVAPAVVQAARLLHVDAVDEATAIHAAEIGRSAGLIVTCDIDHVTPLTRRLVAAVTVPIFAEHVVTEFTGQGDTERALRAIRERHDGLLAVTLGSRGALLLEGDRLHHAPAFAVDVVDTTGAGDVFRGAFIYALLRGDDPQAILRFANAAAAISCTREGAIGGVPTLAEVDALMTSLEPRRRGSELG
jgi:sugar/nucleoside kinase (ribokinase family)